MKVYLCTCCTSGDVSNKFFNMANNVTQNNAPETIATTPDLWLQHKELGMKIVHFSDAPMNMIFLGVTKHNCACWSLIWQQKFELLTKLQNYIGAYQIRQRYRSWLVSHHWWFCRRWLNINHWLAICSMRHVFAPVLGLFWVGGRFWWHYWQNKCKNISAGFCCLVPSYFVPLFRVCLQSGAGWWLWQAFSSSCICYGMSTEKVTKNPSAKKGKRRSEAAFFKDT